MTPAETILYAELTRANHDAPGLPIELPPAVKNAVLRAMERYAEGEA